MALAAPTLPGHDDPLAGARGAMARLHRAPEQEVVAALLPAGTPGPAERPAIERLSRRLVGDMRAAERDSWVNQFLGHWRLDTDEGLALLTLAEAFLRVPDPATADLLIRDRLGETDWRARAREADSMLVHSATWGLVMARQLVTGGRGGPLARLVQRAGEPFVRQAVGAAMRLMGELFVMGRSIDEALARAAREKGFTASFDMLGEAARTHGDAERYMEAYAGAIEALARAPAAGHSVSVKLSALHPRYEASQFDRAGPALAARLEALARRAMAGGVGLTVDAEEQDRLELMLALVETVARRPGIAGWDGLGLAVQAYGKRVSAVVDWAETLAATRGGRLHVRLVKGAYWDSEVKRAQEGGLSDYPLFTRKAHTDLAWLAVARRLLASDRLRPAFATHNALAVATIVRWAGPRRDFEFQRLHGMGAGLYERLVADEGFACRTYAPVGGHRDLLAYLVRRLLENGANSSFVHQLAGGAAGDAGLHRQPADRVAETGGRAHPAIPLPADLYAPERRNSAGLDLADLVERQRVARAVAGRLGSGLPAPPPPLAPADAVARAARGFAPWASTPVAERAAVLERLADRLETRRLELMTLLAGEAAKTLDDGLAEVREAVDFCRYYAARARHDFAPRRLPGPTGEENVWRLAPRGVFACIAPWNFPLAIFLGQAAAALAAGNAVVAKPAPQTPRIAALAVALAHEAGVPADALVLLPGDGAEGEALVADRRVAGVAFTGSTRAAKAIQRALAADEDRPIVPLIAETGGINAMLVDSTALAEQVVADVVTSAFRSAGQRCSALRLLLVQEEVAGAMLAMLKGAMDTLVMGPAHAPDTDVPPVIDAPARDRLEAYRQAMRPRWLHALTLPPGDLPFVPPTLIGLDQPEALTAEWFGPLLHVATWRQGGLEAMVSRVNALGFGLTMGLHSRVARSATLVEGRARAGNLYVNRSMIGAVVGSQPFGGEGLSGTGPKAGGPLYLARFATERVTSTDTTAAGGNASLLAVED